MTCEVQCCMKRAKTASLTEKLNIESTVSSGRRCTHILINYLLTSTYVVLSLIASNKFCSINPQYLKILEIYGAERSDQRHNNIGAGKEIILLRVRPFFNHCNHVLYARDDDEKNGRLLKYEHCSCFNNRFHTSKFRNHPCFHLNSKQFFPLDCLTDFQITSCTDSFPGFFEYFSKWRFMNRHFVKCQEDPGNESMVCLCL